MDEPNTAKGAPESLALYTSGRQSALGARRARSMSMHQTLANALGPSPPPLSELENFPARLRSITAGRGSYNFEFSHYEPAPPQLQQKLQAAHRPQAEAE
jgi:elongation factor G